MPDVPSSAAMVMPLVGLLVTPTRPTMRDATVTKKKANTARSTAATSRCGRRRRRRRGPARRRAWRMTSSTPMPTTLSGRSRPVRGTGHRLFAALAAQLAEADAEAVDHHRQAAHQRDDAGRGHRAGADVAHVAAPQLPGRHVGDQQLGLRIQRQARPPHQSSSRDDHQPRQQAAADHHRGDARPEDVAHAEQRRREVHAQLALRGQGS
jgi:hypothetical protein